VTGLGSVTPIGADAPSTWRAAVAGESGIDFIRSFDASEFPVRVAAEVKDFDPTQVASPKAARRLDRNVLLSLGAAQEAVADAGLGGAYLSIVGAGTFTPFMTQGQGFMAIVIAMLARGKPLWVVAGSFLFGNGRSAMRTANPGASTLPNSATNPG